jgi:hypothetical protein
MWHHNTSLPWRILRCRFRPTPMRYCSINVLPKLHLRTEVSQQQTIYSPGSTESGCASPWLCASSSLPRQPLPALNHQHSLALYLQSFLQALPSGSLVGVRCCHTVISCLSRSCSGQSSCVQTLIINYLAPLRVRRYWLYRRPTGAGYGSKFRCLAGALRNKLLNSVPVQLCLHWHTHMHVP